MKFDVRYLIRRVFLQIIQLHKIGLQHCIQEPTMTYLRIVELVAANKVELFRLYTSIVFEVLMIGFLQMFLIMDEI